MEDYQMQIIKISLVPKEKIDNELFTGSVSLQSLLPESKDYKVSVVHFGKGVRNKLHTHDSDQILIVTSGKGFVANEYEKQEVGVGDVILFPAGEKHWHGATEDSDFSHIYILKKGQKTIQVEI